MITFQLIIDTFSTDNLPKQECEAVDELMGYDQFWAREGYESVKECIYVQQTYYTKFFVTLLCFYALKVILILTVNDFKNDRGIYLDPAEIKQRVRRKRADKFDDEKQS